MRHPPTGEGRRGWPVWLAAAALVAGVALVGVGIGAQRHASQPSQADYGTIDPATTATTASGVPTPSPSTRPSASALDLPTSRPAPTTNAMPASRPVAISIPAIGLHSQVVPIGKTADGTLDVPQPGPNLNKVAWYKDSPTPGQVGPAVLEGHVDTIQGPSVFFRLGSIHIGDTISITRADHTTATFTVDAVRSYPSHAEFPRDEVFGGTTTEPVLRLITCTNFNQRTRHYVGNLVVFAHLTSTH